MWFDRETKSFQYSVHLQTQSLQNMLLKFMGIMGPGLFSAESNERYALFQQATQGNADCFTKGFFDLLRQFLVF
jgi:hypothetical protein